MLRIVHNLNEYKWLNPLKTIHFSYFVIHAVLLCKLMKYDHINGKHFFPYMYLVR